MDKNEAIEDFLKTLRICLTNASVYFKEHPLFNKSLQDLYDKLLIIFNFLSPLKIGIAVDYLLIAENPFEKSRVYQELAAIFHRRKIKNLTIDKNTTKEELATFVLNIALPARELIIKGGIKNILSQANCPHISVDELDYSQLLKPENQNVQDKEIWSYLFEEALEENNLQKIGEFADNFKEIIKKIRPQDFIKDQELKQSIQNFLNFLKFNEEKKFKACSKEILKAIMKDKNISSAEDLKEFNIFLKDLDDADLVDSLWDEISGDADFDLLSFNLFFKLIDKRKHDHVKSLIIDEQNKGLLKVTPQIKKKVRDLFSVPKDAVYEEAYRHAFDFLLKDIVFEDNGHVFNRKNLSRNYRFVLLNLIYSQTNKAELNIIRERIISEWSDIIQDDDFEYFKYLLEVSLKRRNESEDNKVVFSELVRRISETIETKAFSNDTIFDFSYFLNNIETLTFDSFVYLDKIFKENIVNPFLLSLFFKFYPEDFNLFCDELHKRGPDIELSIKIIDAVKKIETQLGLETLKNIFSFSNNFVKIEILKTMQGLKYIDENFLLSVLAKEDYLLKREALLVLKKHEKTGNVLFDILFNIDSKFGRKNNSIIENMMLVDELGLIECKSSLMQLARRPFFWNINLRRKASEILSKWNAK
ncbi:MAG: hypothetical protein AB1755_04210 [Candidatus Omnitrophota bacterium]